MQQISVSNLLLKIMFIPSGKIIVPSVLREWGQDRQRQQCRAADVCKISCACPGVTWVCASVCSVVSLYKAVCAGKSLAEGSCKEHEVFLIWKFSNSPLSPPHHEKSAITFLNICSKSSLWFCPKWNLMYIPMCSGLQFSTTFPHVKNIPSLKFKVFSKPLFLNVVVFSQLFALLMDFMDSKWELHEIVVLLHAVLAPGNGL